MFSCITGIWKLLLAAVKQHTHLPGVSNTKDVQYAAAPQQLESTFSTKQSLRRVIHSQGKWWHLRKPYGKYLEKALEKVLELWWPAASHAHSYAKSACLQLF